MQNRPGCGIKEALIKPIYSFSPIVAPYAKILVLGSIPGAASLKARQYYAHPRNAFWPVFSQLLGFDPGLPYGMRLLALQSAKIALWDVAYSCQRQGSLDSEIKPGSVIPNDIVGLLRKHPTIKHIIFNGVAAESYFKRLIQPQLTCCLPALHRLPSTSPAHASLSMKDKYTEWQTVLELLRKESSS